MSKKSKGFYPTETHMTHIRRVECQALQLLKTTSWLGAASPRAPVSRTATALVAVKLLQVATVSHRASLNWL